MGGISKPDLISLLFLIILSVNLSHSKGISNAINKRYGKNFFLVGGIYYLFSSL